MKKTPFVAMEKDLLNKEIKAIGKVGQRLNVRIQIAALNACYYSIQYGDIGFGQRLLKELTSGQRKNSLVAFLEKHGKFQWDKELKDFVFFKREDLTADSVGDIVEGWWEAVKEPEIVSIRDFDTMATKFLANMEKLIKQDNLTIKNSGMQDHIASAIQQYHVDKVNQDNED